MNFNFNKQSETPVNIGDVLVFSNGNAYLICNDWDGGDYRYVDLVTNKVSVYMNNIWELVEALFSKNNCNYEVIKADNLVLGVKE